MKDISLAQLGARLHFKKMTAEDFKESFNLVDDEGNFVAFVIIPTSAFKKQQFEAMCSQMIAALGLD